MNPNPAEKPGTPPKIEARGLRKRYEGAAVDVLQGIDLRIEAGEFVTFVGASGCGKSTLLRCIGGLERHDGGELRVDGRAVDGPGPERGMVFQHYSLYPWLSVRENIRFCRQLRVHAGERTSAEVEAASGRADALLRLMGLGAVAEAWPAQLSGGMQQRVAIARALMSRPGVLLMDEPFGALDAQTREVMHELIAHVHRLERTTVVFVTHDVEEAIYLGGRVVLMAPRPGRIDTVFEVPLPARRQPDMKHAPEFLALKRLILERIRATTGMDTDHELLERLSAAAAP
ncbi:ABC transporter ATP-binding protein [Sphaerotilus uruguayifluvii]|uniref:NitT/TauT family transport system ATP-binding protein n=1 Tax=Sphaerotilus uruguayifluvii TaxID=2735897 RepID=A0ABX2FYL3_9BURK|nr:ABC transporter ATP-binding protein [Leptothrix sp. C29]NRT55098.1 NitT/TauT family transport system ATP-binding protein [Leptothrix sp. C29]